eukprot:CAMPEP_0177640056 /NCGR_PEP_ID=MMETSP0447-20121125/6345_1 /TAXON_ID=0 /ORGANISM="Stygamoeba regulata, Strain BSH-02190019" /LENGTH=822 /DNA_ID=CAMNT_0019142113 /DNA_START=430 /DNA_END=2898 /DNA_ORIENTATION=-
MQASLEMNGNFGTSNLDVKLAPGDYVLTVGERILILGADWSKDRKLIKFAGETDVELQTGDLPHDPLWACCVNNNNDLVFALAKTGHSLALYVLFIQTMHWTRLDVENFVNLATLPNLDKAHASLFCAGSHLGLFVFCGRKSSFRLLDLSAYAEMSSSSSNDTDAYMVGDCTNRFESLMTFSPTKNIPIPSHKMDESGGALQHNGIFGGHSVPSNGKCTIPGALSCSFPPTRHLHDDTHPRHLRWEDYDDIINEADAKPLGYHTCCVRAYPSISDIAGSLVCSASLPYFVYVIGASAGANPVFKLDLGAMEWGVLKLYGEPLPAGIVHHTADLIDDKIFLIGGRVAAAAQCDAGTAKAPATTPQNDVYCIDLGLRKCEKWATLPSPRSSHSTAVRDHQIIITGGKSGGKSSSRPNSLVLHVGPPKHVREAPLLSDVTSTSVRVSWRPVSAATSYAVLITPSSGEDTTMVSVPCGQTAAASMEAHVPKLKPSTTYRATVQPYNNMGAAPPGPYAQFTTLPFDFECKEESSSRCSLDLSWSTDVINNLDLRILGYRFELSTDNGKSFHFVENVSAEDSECKLKSLCPTLSYLFRVTPVLTSREHIDTSAVEVLHPAPLVPGVLHVDPGMLAGAVAAPVSVPIPMPVAAPSCAPVGVPVSVPLSIRAEPPDSAHTTTNGLAASRHSSSGSSPPLFEEIAPSPSKRRREHHDNGSRSSRPHTQHGSVHTPLQLSTGQLSTANELEDGKKTRQKSKRHHFTVEERNTLEAFFEKNNNPDSSHVEGIANKLSADSQRIKIWFQNRRQKQRKKLQSSTNSFEGAKSSPL